MDKFIKRRIWPLSLRELETNEITILLGPRQVGKTTLFHQLMNHLLEKRIHQSRIFYYNFDDIGLRSKIKKDYAYLQHDIELKIGKPLSQIKDKLYLFIDEGQKSPDIFDLAKIFHDRQYRIKIFISGSSSLNIKHKTAETLVGRIRYIYISPLLFSELIEKDLSIYEKLETNLVEKELKEKAAEGFRNQEKLQNILRKMLVFGSLPKTVFLNQEETVIHLNNIITTYFDKDIKDIGIKVNLENFHLSFTYLADYIGNLFNFSKLASQLGIKRDSLYRYIDLLEKTLVINTVSPFIFPHIKNVFKNRKLFFFDTGIANRLKGFIHFDEFQHAQWVGNLFENFVFSNLQAKSLNDYKKPIFYYFRDYQQHEVDFIYQRGNITIPIETTYSVNIDNKKIINFRTFFQRYPQAKHGILFYLGEVKKITIEDKNVLALPFFFV